jgi:hypothetical protein
MEKDHETIIEMLNKLNTRLDRIEKMLQQPKEELNPIDAPNYFDQSEKR